VLAMSGTEIQTANGKTKVAVRGAGGKFAKGNSIGGRPLGSRNRLSERFLNDLQTVWKKSGRSALERVAKENPETLVKVVANLMPRHLIAQASLDVSLFAETKTFVEAFRVAQDYLGAAEPAMIELNGEDATDAAAN
jgi:hypothetical protein